MALWYIHSLISDPFLTDTLSGSALDTLFHLSLFVMCSDLIAAECSFAVLTWLRKKLLDIQSRELHGRERWMGPETWQPVISQMSQTLQNCFAHFRRPLLSYIPPPPLQSAASYGSFTLICCWLVYFTPRDRVQMNTSDSLKEMQQPSSSLVMSRWCLLFMV